MKIPVLGRGKLTAMRSFYKRRKLPGAIALRGSVAISGDQGRLDVHSR